MKIRTVAILLCVLMLLAVLAGCTDSQEGDGETTAARADGTGDISDVTTAEPAPVFAEANYGNTDFIVYSRLSTAASYSGMYIDSDIVTDTMSEATYARNLAVEEKYGVNIITLEEDSPYKSIRTYISSGDVPFDVVLDRRTYMGSLAQEGNFYNFLDLDHVDFTKPYWDSNCAEGYAVSGKLFFMANDISVSNLAGARFFYFNKQLITEYNLEDPYTLIDNNEWTLDKFLTMVQAVSSDNGDGVWDGSDIYGLLSETGEGNGNIMHMLVGCGVSFIEKNTDGTLITNAYSEKTQSIMTKIGEVLLGTNYVSNYDLASAGADTSGFNNKYDYGRSLFANDHFLFIQGNMGISGQFKDMKSDYGVAPNPKYDAAQESYFHKMDRYSLIWAIPKCDMDYDKTGIIMEYWAYESSKTVMPAYYEITIKTKRVQEETASRMIDLIKSTIHYDISEIYSGDILGVLHTGYTSGNLSSTWAASKKVLEKSLDKIYTTISALE